MKHFLVSDDIGNPIYFDHPDGRMLCLPVSTCQDVMNANFGDIFTSMTCGDTVYVFQRYEQLTFTVVSDQGESEAFLRSQLRLVHEILLFIFGPKTLYHPRQTNFLKHQKLVQKLVDTMCWLSEHNQSFAVESIEMVEVNDDIKHKCFESLRRALDKLPGSLHGMLFVGTKLLTSYTKPRATELSSMDIYLIIAYFQGQFHPHVHQMEETVIPIADYTDHGREESLNDSLNKEVEVEIEIEPEEELVDESLVEQGEAEEEPSQETTSDSEDPPSTPLRQSANTSYFDESPPPPVQPPICASVFLRNAAAYAAHSIYLAELESSLTLVIVSRNLGSTPEERDQLTTVQNAVKRSIKNYIDYLLIKERTHLSILTYLHQLPGLVHFIFVDRTSNRVIAPTIGPLHGQQCVPQEETSVEMVKILRQKIWDLCYQSQKHLSLGYCSMLIKQGDFQYAYRLWVEDKEGVESAFEQPLAQGSSPISHTFYKELLKKTSRGARCCELYSLYLGVVPVSTVANYERRLIGIARNLLQRGKIDGELSEGEDSENEDSVDHIMNLTKKGMHFYDLF